jgi:hypothetical protein
MITIEQWDELLQRVEDEIVEALVLSEESKIETRTVNLENIVLMVVIMEMMTITSKKVLEPRAKSLKRVKLNIKRGQ